MLQPRNSLVTVVEVKDKESLTGKGIVIPAETGREYKRCEVISVGPGMIMTASDLNTASDLHPGQVVLVKLQAQRQIGPDAAILEPIGVSFTSEDGRALKLVDQTQIVAILDPAPEKELTFTE